MWLDVLRLKYRVGPFSVPDTLGSLIIAALISPILSWLVAKLGFRVPYVNWLWLTIPVAELTHAFFRPDTAFFKMLVDPSGGWLVKLAMIIMLIMGFRGIHRI